MDDVSNNVPIDIQRIRMQRQKTAELDAEIKAKGSSDSIFAKTATGSAIDELALGAKEPPVVETPPPAPQGPTPPKKGETHSYTGSKLDTTSTSQIEGRNVYPIKGRETSFASDTGVTVTTKKNDWITKHEMSIYGLSNGGGGTRVNGKVVPNEQQLELDELAKAIADLNGIANRHDIKPGQQIFYPSVITVNGKTYKAQGLEDKSASQTVSHPKHVEALPPPIQEPAKPPSPERRFAEPPLDDSLDPPSPFPKGHPQYESFRQMQRLQDDFMVQKSSAPSPLVRGMRGFDTFRSHQSSHEASAHAKSSTPNPLGPLAARRKSLTPKDADIEPGPEVLDPSVKQNQLSTPIQSQTTPKLAVEKDSSKVPAESGQLLDKESAEAVRSLIGDAFKSFMDEKQDEIGLRFSTSNLLKGAIGIDTEDSIQEELAIKRKEREAKEAELKKNPDAPLVLRLTPEKQAMIDSYVDGLIKSNALDLSKGLNEAILVIEDHLITSVVNDPVIAGRIAKGIAEQQFNRLKNK